MQVFSSAPQSCIILLLIVILNENFRAPIIVPIVVNPFITHLVYTGKVVKTIWSRILAKSRVGSLTSHKNQNDKSTVIERQGLRFFHLIREDQNFSPFLDARTIAERHSPQSVNRLPKKDSLFTSIQAPMHMVRSHQF